MFSVMQALHFYIEFRLTSALWIAGIYTTTQNLVVYVCSLLTPTSIWYDNIKIYLNISRLLRYKSHFVPQDRLKMDGFANMEMDNGFALQNRQIFFTSWITISRLKDTFYHAVLFYSAYYSGIYLINQTFNHFFQSALYFIHSYSNSNTKYEILKTPFSRQF